MNTAYLILFGSLSDDNRIELRLGGLTDAPSPIPEDQTSPLVAEVFDSAGQLILRRHVALQTSCAFPAETHAHEIVDRIPLRDDAMRVRLARDGAVLHEFPISRVAPTVRLTWQATEWIEGTHAVTWEGGHPDGRPLHYVVRYTHDDGRRWQAISLRTAATQMSVDFDQLPGGNRCRLAVAASDGINTTVAESGSFRVAVKPCRAMILAPADGQTYQAGRPVTLRGQGFYLEDNTPETELLAWTSSQDGEIGRGMVVDLFGLSLGEHRMTLAAGEGERAGRATISIRIVGDPGAKVPSPPLDRDE